MYILFIMVTVAKTALIFIEIETKYCHINNIQTMF